MTDGPAGSDPDPTPPSGEGVRSPSDAGAPEAPSGRLRSIPRRPLLVAVLAVVVAGAAVGIAVALTSSSGGSPTPAAAVEKLLQSGDRSDVLGALAVVDPGERDALEPGLETLVGNLQRLHVLSPQASLNQVQGVSLNFSGVRTTTTYLNGSLALVRFDGGTAKSSADIAKLPLGSFVEGIAKSAITGQKATHEHSSLNSGNEGIATVKVDGGWYVSLGYTIAVDNLASSHKTETPPRNPVPASGSATSSGAVQSLLNAAVGLDARGAVAVLPPDEMAALQAYAPLFAGRVGRARQAVNLSVTTLSTTTQSLGSGTLVKVTGIAIGGSIAGATFSFSDQRGCTSLTIGTRHQRECGSASAQSQLQKLLPASLRPLATRLARAHPDLGFVTVEENGRWFVSPTRTLFQDVNAELGELRPGDLVAIAAALPAIKQAIQREQSLLAGKGPTLL